MIRTLDTLQVPDCDYVSILIFLFLSRRSEKLKPFIQTVLEKEDMPVFHYLDDVLFSTTKYEEAVNRALAIADCPVVPFFGFFIRDLKQIMVDTPSTVVLADQQNEVNFYKKINDCSKIEEINLDRSSEKSFFFFF